MWSGNSTGVSEVDIDEMLATLLPEELTIVRRLRAIVRNCLPHATEKIYPDINMPFYAKNRLICFIQPSSAFLGSNTGAKRHKAKGVALGFNQGHLMANEEGLLLSEGRKQVYKMYFHTTSDIDEKQVMALLFEAEMIDKEFRKKRSS